MKKLKLLSATTIIATAMSITAFAGQWKQDNIGWWYQNDNGTYPANGWQDVNGKQYFFNSSGYLLTNTTTPDGKQVDANGYIIPAPLFDLDLDDSHVRYVRYELSTALYNNPCIIIYYDYTNLSDKNQSVAGSIFYMSVIQNHEDRGIDTLSRNVDEIDNFYKSIAPGATITVAEVFSLVDRSPVTLKFEKLYSLKDCRPIGTAVLNLE